MQQNFILTWIDTIYETVTQATNRIASILAPAPSAIALYMAVVDSFGVPASVVLAFVVEGLGFATVELLMRALSRSTRRPLQIGAGIFAAIYLGTVFALLALIPDGEEWAGVARAFPLLTVVGAGVVAGNRVLDDDEAEPFNQERQKIELKHLRLSLRDERRRADVPTSVPTVPVVSQPKDTEDTEGRVVAYFRDNPDASLRQAAADLGIGKTTVGRYKPTETEPNAWHAQSRSP